MIHVTELLSSFIGDLSYDDLPEEVVETLKRFLIDYYAACFAGIRVNGEFNRAIEGLILSPGGQEECDTLLSLRRVPVASAAFMNAIYAHGADMDDGNRKAMGHVGCHVLSALLALAQKVGASGRDLLVAMDAGYEVYNRIAAAAQPGLVHRGFHSTGTAGAVACGAACAKLLGLDREGIYDSMAIAAVQASGLMLSAESGQACKPLNPANAARTGVVSALLAAQGIKGPRDPLESSKGWFHAMCDAPALEMITADLGTVHTVCESYIKPYPSCRHTHGAIDAALKLREEVGDVSSIRAVRVYIYPNAIRIAGQIVKPASGEECKFSIHYALAVALIRGRFSLDDLDPEGLEESVTDILDRIQLIADDQMEQRDRGIRGAKVVIETVDDAEYACTVLIPRGDAANPLSMEELREKLADCADGIIGTEEQDALTNRILTLEQLKEIRSINLFAL
ncbi:MAG: MmgE/PrpD family protein [Clostridia bacterium]|nr:MmgE/PrpD family protein [Clostridia bacterium]